MAFVVAVQHHDSEPLALVGAALHAHGVGYRYVRTQDGDPVPPDIGDAAGLVVLGGPMGVYEQDQYPFLKDELALIMRTVQQGRPVLGVCLGSQLLSAALGGEVHKNTTAEIGWHEIRLTEAAASDPLWRAAPQRFVGFHWHGDIFTLPAGAASLAQSDVTPCQAFRHGCAWGVQCHLEVDAETVHDWARAYAADLRAAGVDPADLERGVSAHLEEARRIGATVFGAWAQMVA